MIEGAKGTGTWNDEEKVKAQPAEIKFAADRQLAIEQKHAGEALLASKGWSILAQYVQAEIDRLTDEVINTPLYTSPEVTAERQEYVKGCIKGLKTVLGLPEQMKNVSSDVLETLPPEEDDADDETDGYDELDS